MLADVENIELLESGFLLHVQGRGVELCTPSTEEMDAWAEAFRVALEGDGGGEEEAAAEEEPPHHTNVPAGAHIDFSDDPRWMPHVQQPGTPEPSPRPGENIAPVKRPGAGADTSTGSSARRGSPSASSPRKQKSKYPQDEYNEDDGYGDADQEATSPSPKSPTSQSGRKQQQPGAFGKAAEAFGAFGKSPSSARSAASTRTPGTDRSMDSFSGSTRGYGGQESFEQSSKSKPKAQPKLSSSPSWSQASNRQGRTKTMQRSATDDESLAYNRYEEGEIRDSGTQTGFVRPKYQSAPQVKTSTIPEYSASAATRARLGLKSGPLIYEFEEMRRRIDEMNLPTLGSDQWFRMRAKSGGWDARTSSQQESGPRQIGGSYWRKTHGKFYQKRSVPFKKVSRCEGWDGVTEKIMADPHRAPRARNPPGPRTAAVMTGDPISAPVHGRGGRYFPTVKAYVTCKVGESPWQHTGRYGSQPS
eukprot:gnl/MRDRNA2_/MRDRNA2_122041_c0_seq1.p1 gnl/MRDRNA2_/MRDRNA2_122041_c0~~gnl/MRDRNA2_/MRDRNA2_122041_c0_seq1.p1  ORF type:complete len:549 (-),score=95.06 gnl/MRDRNA2_/MRDRNA2_122041_c0_seq1:54-1475(-)